MRGVGKTGGIYDGVDAAGGGASGPEVGEVGFEGLDVLEFAEGGVETGPIAADDAAGDSAALEFGGERSADSSGRSEDGCVLDEVFRSLSIRRRLRETLLLKWTENDPNAIRIGRAGAHSS
jgi:hypothetical protein